MVPPEIEPFYLIVTDLDRGVFAEGPMTDSRPWDEAATYAQSHRRHIICGPTGAQRDDLASEHRRAHKLAGVPPGKHSQTAAMIDRRSSATEPTNRLLTAEFRRLADAPAAVE